METENHVVNPSQKGLISIIGDEPFCDSVQFEVMRLSDRPRVRRFDALSDYLSIMTSSPWQMILIDIRASMKATPEHREQLAQLNEYLPVVRVRKTPTSISAAISGISIEEANLESEIAKILDNTVARITRRSDRVKTILNIEFASNSNQNSDESFFLTNTYNVSRHGLFLITGESMNMDDEIIFRAQGCEQNFKGIVKWVLPWGKSIRHFAGIGLEVVENTQDWEDFLTHSKVF